MQSRLLEKIARKKEGNRMKRTGIKRAAALAMAAVLAAAGAFGVYAEESRFGQPEFDLPCKAAVLMEQGSGTVLYAKNPDIQLPEASITKVMTLLLTFEALQAGKVHKEDLVPVSEHSYSMGGSQIWLEPGEQFTLDEMLRAVCVSSANDAAVAVAEFIGGSETVFVEQMNRRAAELGMNNTHYVNACGLDAPGHVSSARDVAILSREMLTKHPDITEYTTIWTDSLRGGQTQLVNTNKLLRRYAGTNGLKTGTTSGAGVCITASASRDGLDLIAVVLGAADSDQRFAAAKALLDYGFANFENGQIEKPENAPESLPVSGGESENAVLQYALPARLLLKKGEGAALQTTALLPEVLPAPLEEGQKVGSVCVKMGESVLAEYPVCAAKAVPRLKMHGAWLHILHGMTVL